MEATIGGTKRHLLALIRGLDRNQFEVEVAAPEIRSEAFDDVTFTKEVREAGIKQHFVPMQRAISPGSDLRSFSQLVALMARGRYDLVHTHSSKAGFLGRFAARAAGVKVTVHTPHGFYFLNQKPGRKRSFYLQLERMAGLTTSRIIALSPTEMAEAVDNGIIKSDRIALIENGIRVPAVPSDGIVARLRETLAPEAEYLVGTVARFTPQKGPFDFVRMTSHLVQLVPGVHVLWCGDGELREQVESLAGELGVSDRLHFLGYRTDVLDIMSTLDLFVLTSLWEGLPYTVLDAMALGKPVVATAAVGTRDIVQEGVTGLLTPVGEPAAAAEAIARLLRAPAERQAMGTAGHETILRRFSQEAMVKRTGQLYVDLVG
ncbi:MAG TPA: glycosyltransferase family 4 protein [Chloroflexota bacterium]|nr:glycosyltransferase family 4 protein [Chloroflexota bacterium]